MLRSILITGATGKQGGAVISALLANNANFTLLAVTRNPNSASAQRLAARSPLIKLIKGNLNDVSSLFSSARNASPNGRIWGVFSVQTMMGDGQNANTEEKQGKALVDEALRNEVGLFVYSSTDRHGDISYDNPTNVPHWISKYNIEHHLVNSTEATDMQYTILRPAVFMENLGPDFLGKGFATGWKIMLQDRPMQFISTADIGILAAKAFLDPSKFAGRGISIAGDSLTFDQANKIWKEKMGHEIPTTYEFLTRMYLWWYQDIGTMMMWFRDPGMNVDIERVREEHPGVIGFETWLDGKEKKKNK
ncbi:NmrA-like family protein [Amniculicola lignicola CBS 123094]|uniref:NmrA-like family protein n=1 Tax=Amniculicola lignicola CBS 123094 TaxID=1392246 RepID=A0A6A5X357_9PLEO|nr:NmrA-like family protein [Amniculicola lignicola CBS 123094]